MLSHCQLFVNSLSAISDGVWNAHEKVAKFYEIGQSRALKVDWIQNYKKT